MSAATPARAFQDPELALCSISGWVLYPAAISAGIGGSTCEVVAIRPLHLASLSHFALILSESHALHLV